MKILFTIAYLHSGGAQRVLEILGNKLSERGHEVSILCISEPADARTIVLDERIKVAYLGSASSLRTLGAKVKKAYDIMLRLRRSVMQIKPDLIVSLGDQTNILALISTLKTGIPIIVSERIYPAHHTLLWTAAPALLQRIASSVRSVLYLLADRIVVQNELSKYFFPSILQNKIDIIPNPVPTPPARDNAEKFVPEKSIVTLGRLHPQKRHDLLIDAFELVSHRYPDWSLYIFGEGGERSALTAKRDKLGLSKKIHLPGFSTDHLAILRQAEIFVLSSDFEGFPNALAEAMASGCAVVSTDCPTGPNELIQNGVDGILVPIGDRNHLAKAIVDLIEDEKKRKILGQEAKKIVERFNPETVVDMWETLFASKKMLTA